MLKDGKLKCYWVTCNNNMQAGPNINDEMYPGWRNPEAFVVVSDPYPTVSALAADLILRNGRIHTLGARSSIASALAIRDGRILAVGGEGDLDGLAGPETKIMDLGGRTAIPGIVDSHCHPDSYAARLAGWEDVGPNRIQSRAALLARLSDVAAARGTDEWVVAYRLNENKSGGYPTLAELDAVGQGRPLFILRTDGHIGYTPH